MESKLKHLEFVQGVIARLAANSFRVRNWALVLISATLAILAHEGRSGVDIVALLPILAFWGLDSYYLCQERRFRALYDHVRCLPAGEVDFSMDVKNTGDEHLPTWRGAMFSKTPIMFYAMLILLSLASIMTR